MIHSLKTHAFFKRKTIDSCVLLEYQGYCNENYLVRVAKERYIVRKLLRDDIDRDLEYQIQGLAFTKGITAEPLVYDKNHSFMLSEFLEGEHKTFMGKDEVKLLAKTLQKLHNIAIDSQPIKILINNKTNEVLKAFEAIRNYPKEYVLCHNDLNPQNLLWYKKTLKLIDWEYAGVNDRYFDLGAVCVEFDLSREEELFFLGCYFGTEKAYNIKKIDAYKIVYQTLCSQWFGKTV